MIERRPLGAFGEAVGALALGAGALARAGADAPWEATIDAALAVGMDGIDAAQARHRRASELRLGEALLTRRDEVFLSTRCSPLDGDPFEASPAEVRRQLEESLRAMRTDRIDLYHVHDIEATATSRVLETLLPTLVEARERGDVRYIGASGGDPAALLEVLRGFPVDAVLSYARLDLVDDELLAQVVPEASERGVALINASPLHMGVLARPEVTARGREENEPVALAAESAFRQAEGAGLDLPRLALAFAATQPSVATTIVGCSSPAEVERCALAFSSPATPAEEAAIAAIRETFRASR